MWSGAGGFIVTTGTLVVLMPSFRARVTYSLFQDISLELFNEELVLSSLARCLTYCESAGLWLNGACCLDHSRNCEPLLHTSDDVLLPMVFIKQVVNMLRVCGPVQTVFTGPVRVAAQYVIPTQRGGGINSFLHSENSDRGST